MTSGDGDTEAVMLRLAGSAAYGASPGTATEARAGASITPTKPMASPAASTAARIPFHFRRAPYILRGF
jgi:hypothetical protein